MFGSRFYYLIAGFDIAFALMSAMVHNPTTFMFMILSGLMMWVGDKKYAEEKGEKQ